MRKGFTQTLLAIAVVMMAVQAMASAPVIGDIKSPVVGNLELTTPANAFVFPNAIDLSQFVTDEETVSTDINWSYEVMVSGGATPKYQINGLDGLTPTEALNPETPPAGKIIAGPDKATATVPDPDQGDDPAKITIRNSNLSPIDGTYTVPGTTGVIEDETQLVTLYASDGTTFTAKSIWFYTTSNENDRLSPADTGTNCVDDDFATDDEGYGFNPGNDAIGTVTPSYEAGQICLTTVAAGDNLAKYAAPYGGLDLVANNIYRIRATINGDQTNADLVPWWDMCVNNYGYLDPKAKTGLSGMNLYGGNYMFLSKAGGANAATVAKSPMVFEMWWCPAPVSKAEWNSTSETQPGPSAASNTANKNGFIEFRILDVASNPGANGAALGKMCLTQLTVDRVPIDALGTPIATLYDTADDGGITSGGQDGTSGTGNTRVENGGSSASFDATAKTVTLTPTNASEMLSHITPGDFTYDVFYETETEWIDNYPAQTAKQALYLITISLSAPTQNDVDHPMDMFWIGADSVSNELINLSYVTLNSWHRAMPTLAASDYKFLFYSNYGTDDAKTWFQRIRPRMMLSNSPGIGGTETNVGAMKVHNMKIEQVNIPQ